MTAVHLEAREPTPLRESLPRLDALCSPLTGLVRRLDRVLAAPDDARLIRIGAVCGDTSPLIGADPAPLDGAGGWATHESGARAAAVGELVERYSACLVPEPELVLASADELGPVAVDPERFALFAAAQHAVPGFPFVPFERSTRIRWVRGFSLPGGEEAWLPAQLVYLPPRRAAGEAPVASSTSSGLACGPTLEEAVLGGLLELVERDAFMLTWTNRLSLPLLDWSGDPELCAFERRYLAPAGAGHAAVDLSVFLGVPAALGVVRGDGVREPAVAVGAAAAATAAAAVGKALAEAYSVRTWARALLRRPTRRAGPVTTFEEHIERYAVDAAPTEFLAASPRRVRTCDVVPLGGATPLAQIVAVARRLAGQGASAYAVEVTAQDVADAGLRVVKVVAPELCALDVRDDARFLGGPRLYEAPVRLGLRTEPLTWRSANPDPHPFP